MLASCGRWPLLLLLRTRYDRVRCQREGGTNPNLPQDFHLRLCSGVFGDPPFRCRLIIFGLGKLSPRANKTQKRNSARPFIKPFEWTRRLHWRNLLARQKQQIASAGYCDGGSVSQRLKSP